VTPRGAGENIRRKSTLGKNRIAVSGERRCYDTAGL